MWGRVIRGFMGLLGLAFGWAGFALSMAVYGSVLVSPGFFWPAQFVGFAIPWVLLANFLGAAFFIRQKKYIKAAFPLAALLPGIWFLPATFQVPKTFSVPMDEARLNILSFNMSSLAGKRSRPEMKRLNAREMMDWILKRNDDLLILQEFYENPAVKEFMPIEKFRAKGYKSILFSNHKQLYAQKGYGLAIVSRYPLSNLKVWERQLETNNQIVTAEMQWLGVRYRVINVHLQSNQLTWGEIGIKRSPEELVKNMLSIFKKMKEASKLRASQVALVCQLIDESPFPVILAGDFNDTPYSYTYWQIHRRLKSSFEKAGRGFGFTYNGKLPGLRIDHQFVSKELECVEYRTHREIDLSDHLPISGAYILSGD